MIKEISIFNFKGIKEGKLEDLAQINILAGKNNTGKSTVLESLMFCCQAQATYDPLMRDRNEIIRSRRTIKERFNERELHYNLDTSHEIKIQLRFTNEVAFTRTRWVGQWEGSPTPDNYRFVEKLLLIDYNSIREFLIIEKEAWSRLPHIDRKDKEIRDILREIYQLEMEQISFLPVGGGFKLAIFTPQGAVPIDCVGDGLRYATAILSVAAILDNTALLIEEPEVHQHPESLKRLLLALFKIVKRHQIQLFISTHSLELIYFALEAAEKEGLDIKIYHLTLSPNGILKARGIPFPDAKLLADLGEDFRMLYKFVRG